MSPDDKRREALEALKRERSPIYRMKQAWITAAHKDNRDFSLEVVKIVISGFGVLATIFAGVGLYLTYQNTQREQQLSSERLVTDRFAKAVEQLGNENIDVRIGSIYALERMAKDSPKDHWTIMEVLTAFVRNRSPLSAEPKQKAKDPNQKPTGITTDIQSALTVIGRRDMKNEPSEFVVLRTDRHGCPLLESAPLYLS